METKWEFKIVPAPPSPTKSELTELLDGYGLDGWSVAGYSSDHGSFILQRPILEE